LIWIHGGGWVGGTKEQATMWPCPGSRWAGMW
jgi:hypothetical protein